MEAGSLQEEAQHFPGLGSPTLPVHGEVLKPKDVQETDGPASVRHFLRGWFVDCCIDLLHNPYKEPPIDALKGTHEPRGKAALPEQQSLRVWAPALDGMDTPGLHGAVPATAHALLLQQPLICSLRTSLDPKAGKESLWGSASSLICLSVLCRP